ncbi:MAG TPA: adenosine deaminase [Thermoanaerobaculia bacterium]|nr:adenosine deaminase [Thermoanaerobaculia bacterium]
MDGAAAAPGVPALADCHLHFEGCLPAPEIARLAARSGHPFADPDAFARARASVADAAGFLDLFATVCRLFRRPEDYVAAALAVAGALADDGLAYAEVYVSPEIFTRCGLDAAACLEAIDTGFREALETRGILCRILLDAVRHWGPESADRVLDLYARRPLPTIVGFGMGGDEASVPAAAFAGVYLRARALGLHTSVHAGEWAGAASVRDALDALRPDRIDHGIAAADDERLLERLAEEGTVLCVAPTGNVQTRAVASVAAHPLRRLLRAGVRVTLSADDPVLFGTTTRGEYRFARRELALEDQELRALAANSWRAAFCSREQRERGMRAASALDF